MRGSVTFSTPSGLAIRGHVVGADGGRVVLLLHGGGQTRHAWDRTADALAERGFRVLALDLRGHGDSDWAPDGDYSLSAFAGDLVAVLDDLGEPAALVGASLGGLTSLLVAGETERPVSAIVLVDVTPRLEVTGVRKIVGFMTAHRDGFASLDDAADAIAAYLPHRPRPKSLDGLAKNLRLGADGRYRWHWDPSFITGKRPPDTAGISARLMAAAHAIAVPALLVRGRHSEIVSEQSVDEFRTAVPHAEFVDVADARHMVAGDQNDAFSAAVVEFLARVVPHGT